MNQFCRTHVVIESENEFLSILKESNITSYEFVEKTRYLSKTYSIYDFEFKTPFQYEIIARNADKCKLL